MFVVAGFMKRALRGMLDATPAKTAGMERTAVVDNTLHEQITGKPGDRTRIRWLKRLGR
jgi:hypothetical protein